MSLAQMGIEEGALLHASQQKDKVQSKFDWKQYLIYHCKWQLGIIITGPLMYLFIDHLHLNYWLAVFLFQLVGAVIFYPIDTSIFGKKAKVLNLLYQPPVLDDQIKNQLLQDHANDLKNEALREIEDPDFNSALEYCDWKYKVPVAFQQQWSSLSEDVKLSIYYMTKLQALGEEE